MSQASNNLSRFLEKSDLSRSTLEVEDKREESKGKNLNVITVDSVRITNDKTVKIPYIPNRYPSAMSNNLSSNSEKTPTFQLQKQSNLVDKIKEP